MSHPANTSLDVIVLQQRIRELEAELLKVDRGAYQMGLYTGEQTQAARIAELERSLAEVTAERDQYMNEVIYLDNGD